MADLPTGGTSEGPQGGGEEVMDTSGSSTSTMDTPLPVPDQLDEKTDVQEGNLMLLPYGTCRTITTVGPVLVPPQTVVLTLAVKMMRL